MNTCILMVKIIQDPELRYTQDTQTEMSRMMVEFEGLRPEDEPASIRVVGWGNLAKEIQEKYRAGDRVIIEGRLSMNVIEIDGYKEKKAELTAQRIYPLGSVSATSSTNLDTEKVVAMDAYKPKMQELEETNLSSNFNYKENKSSKPSTSTDKNLDEIPF